MMLQFRLGIIATVLAISLRFGGLPLQGQQEIGYIEKFALSDDRREALKELIPGTDEFFYFHCLHYQNEKQLAEAEAILTQWRAKLGNTERVRNMEARQVLLRYDENPKRALDFLRRQLNLNFNHSPPSRDRAATLPTQLDNSRLDIKKLLDETVAQDRSLAQIETSGLPLLLDRQLAPNQLRTLIDRLRRADFPQVVRRIAEELALKDSRGFGWAKVHRLLTLEQLTELLQSRQQLREDDNFVRAYTVHLAPPEGTSLTDKKELRSYLNRLATWIRTLPQSQNSFKALVLGNLLRLDMSENKYDRALFLEYLELPRSAPYYDVRRLRSQRVPMAELSYAMSPQVPLPAMGDDSALVRRFLEHFFRDDRNVNAFARVLKRDYLEQVYAESKILNGAGDAATWYAKLTPAQQRQIRERIEIRFAPHNISVFKADAEVSLNVELKNVDELTVKIYEINTAGYLRGSEQSIGTDVDLDGLVANAQHKLSFSQPADVRHSHKIDLKELDGRGVWVIDLLGGGQRSRALIQKGKLVAVERLGDAGHVFRIFDELGNPVETAHIEFAGRKYASENGQIVLPYAEKTVTRNLLVVDGSFATRTTIAHLSERYELKAGFLLDRQSLVAGTQAAIAINTRLSCNRRPISISLLENPQLTITATDADGITTSQTVSQLDLEDGDELLHSFLVPQRLRTLKFDLSGQIYNQNRDEKQTVRTSHSVSCNGIAESEQIGDFFLQRLPKGYRVLVLGRNGEPVARLPVTISIKLEHFKHRQSFSLATDAQGVVECGLLENTRSFTASAQGIQQIEFSPHLFHRDWPTTMQIATGEHIELPLGKETSDREQFSLYEIRRRIQHIDMRENLTIQHGSLAIADLTPGDYVLTDHEAGQVVRIAVSSGQRDGQFVVGNGRVLQTGRANPIVIRNVTLDEKELFVEVDGADPMTRVHIIATAFSPAVSSGRQIQIPGPPLMSRSLTPVISHYVDSLTLDEEYSYILDRQGHKHYPGNMLPHPTILVHPWEVSVTENSSKEAAMGDAIPPSAAPKSAASRMDGEAEARRTGGRPDWKSFDFLAGGAAIAANLGLEDGRVRIPAEQFSGYSSITVVAVHPTASDSRQIVLGEGNVPIRDQRLRSAFDSTSSLAQTQRVEFLTADQQKTLGDPKTRRLQTYTTVGDVFQLYSTLLKDSQWEKFRFISRWPLLEDEEKQAHYSEMSCHELDFFLFQKDRTFFDSVVKPLIEQKLDKQLVDRWLLGESLEEYTELWRTQRLNTLERVLVAQRIEAKRLGTLRWLDDTMAANPMHPKARQDRFEVALRGTALSTDRNLRLLLGEELSFGANASMAPAKDFAAQSGFAGGGYGVEKAKRRAAPSARNLRRKRSSGRENESLDAVAEQLMESDDFFDSDRPGRSDLGRQLGFFQSLDKTREWAETQYYKVRLSDQTSALIRPNPFWRQYLATGGEPFMPSDLDLPCNTVNESLCALAVIDLPFTADAPNLRVEDEQLVISSTSPVIIFLESTENSSQAEDHGSILVGQDIYLAAPDTARDASRPVQQQPLLRGVPYRTSVVVTNPTSEKRRVQVLTQLPAGSLPLAGAKSTRSTALELESYSTAQVQYMFYFPSEGEFEHYGAQISDQTQNLAGTDSAKLTVLAQLDTVDQTTWSYIADWGTKEQVLQFLGKTNLQQLDLSRIAFRMADREFYDAVLQLLANAGQYEPSLWAYAVRHNDATGIQQLLQNDHPFIARLGSSFNCDLLSVDPQQQMSYEHLDYTPLVVARIHRLGKKHTILNPNLHSQYHRLLDVLAHQGRPDDARRLQVCYYLLLQNRIEDALTWFGRVSADQLETRMQYDYFDAYLDFYHGNYDRASQISEKYAQYPVPRWNDLFSQIRVQVAERAALVSGQQPSSTVSRDDPSERSEKMLTDQRQSRQTELSNATPVLELESRNGQLELQFRNTLQVRVNYYLMDIELLFSRKPFVSRDKETAPVIQPNFHEDLQLPQAGGTRKIDVPDTLRNKNLLVEVIAEGISRRQVVTANSLAVVVTEPYGQLQVTSRKGRGPVEGAYVKVYARHNDGSIRFYKDGYTDLRGRFDYATLSTGDLDSTERFAILVLHPELGAEVQESDPPTR